MRYDIALTELNERFIKASTRTKISLQSRYITLPTPMNPIKEQSLEVNW